uniref:Thioredoxin-disulfide reductase n=1 Tax=Soboliphyme baturini TaxID=241478 RepID=A0A183INJ2_9BILA
LVFVKGDCVGNVCDLAKLHSSGLLKEKLQDHQYDLVVIGGGSGGLAAAKEAGEMGKRVAVLDFVMPTPIGTTWGLGGTCLNVGCIPKKIMHQGGLLGQSIKDAAKFGWQVNEDGIFWNTYNNAVQSYIARLNWGNRVALREKLVTYVNGYASFTSSHEIKAIDKNKKETRITSDRFLICTGLRPRYLDIPGAKEYCITSDDLFSLSYCPGKTLCVGASYVSLECAGFLRELGLDVTVMVRSILLRGFDQDMAERVGKFMADEVGVEKIEDGIPGLLRVTAKSNSGETIVDEYNTVSTVVGVLSCSIVCYSNEQSVSAPHVYAIGDTLDGRPELTPVAIHAGRLLVPTTVFTPLEYGACGMPEEVAIDKYGKDSVQVYHSLFFPVEYSIADRKDSDHCYAKVVCHKDDDDRILGMHVIGPNAGEIMQGFALALSMKARKRDLNRLIGIHPTSAEVFTTMQVIKAPDVVLTKTSC